MQINTGPMVAILNGFNVYINNNLPSTFKYPTGKKDGNKLGLRKRKMVITNTIVVGNNIFMTRKDFDKLYKLDLTNKKQELLPALS